MDVRNRVTLLSGYVDVVLLRDVVWSVMGFPRR